MMTTHALTTRPLVFGPARVLLFSATLVYLAAVAGVTLGPQPLNAALRDAIFSAFAIVHIDLPVSSNDVEFAANVAMFVPFGVLVALWLSRTNLLVRLACGALLSTAIEVAQLFIPGRVTDMRDIVANTIGASIGVLVISGLRLGRTFLRAVAPPPPSA